VVASVCIDLGRLTRSQRLLLTELDDSKRLAPAVRQRLAGAIARVADQVVVLSASAATIDRDGLHVTNLRLLRRSLELLDPVPELCLVDGFSLGDGAPGHRAIVGGDRRSACIAAASVVAKATRDRLMTGPAASAHPGYGFERHVGYATGGHRDAIRCIGPSGIHRRSFASPAFAGFD
jgi:ribonuclease HII